MYSDIALPAYYARDFYIERLKRAPQSDRNSISAHRARARQPIQFLPAGHGIRRHILFL